MTNCARTRRAALPGALGLTCLLILSACGGEASSEAATPVETTTATADASPTPTTTPTTEPTTEPEASPSASAQTSPAVRQVEISVTGNQVTPAPGRVEIAVGETIELVITSDVANSLHVHGVDLEADLPPGTPVVLPVTGQETGAYEIELHDPVLLLALLIVR